MHYFAVGCVVVPCDALFFGEMSDFFVACACGPPLRSYASMLTSTTSILITGRDVGPLRMRRGSKTYTTVYGADCVW